MIRWVRQGEPPDIAMTTYMPFDREQPFLLPPDVKDWLPANDIAHFIVAAVKRVRLAAFHTNSRPSGKPQYHPRLMLALLVYSYANGVFSSRRIERATYRDVGTRFIAANTHPDHDTIANFRRTNKQAFEAAFLQVLLLAREMGLLRLGTVSIDGTKIDANPRRSARCATTGQGAARQTHRRHRRLDRCRRRRPTPRSTRRRCRPRSPGARRSRRSSTPPARGWRRKAGRMPNSRIRGEAGGL